MVEAGGSEWFVLASIGSEIVPASASTGSFLFQCFTEARFIDGPIQWIGWWV